MSKKVLVVEQSLAVRGVAESLLRQNGFEVVTADSAAQAKEILGSSVIDLILLSSEMTDESGQPLYESLGTDKKTAAIPLLLLHDQNIEEAPAFPPESVVGKPFTPREFIAAIGPFLGGDTDLDGKSSPFSGADFEEDLIDTALGLDKIEVHKAEVLEDDTAVYRKSKKKPTTESMIGFEFKVSPDDTGKVVHKKFDSVTIPADDKKESEPETPQDKEAEDSGELEILEEKHTTPEPLSDSSKLELSTDQYGLTASHSADGEQLVDDTETHDYEWFLSELRKETDGAKAADDELPPSIPTGHQVSLDAEPETSKTDKPKQGQPSAKKQEVDQKPAAASDHGEAIDKFISEFKKEVDKITGDEPEKIDVATVAADEGRGGKDKKSGDGLSWDEGMEKLPPDQIREISGKIVALVAQRVADQIIARIDPNVVYHLIKDAVDAYLGREKGEKSKQTS